jgi:hypothetical protein
MISWPASTLNSINAWQKKAKVSKEPWKQNKEQRYSSRYLMYMCISSIYLSLSGFLSGIFGLAEKSLSAMSE